MKRSTSLELVIAVSLSFHCVITLSCLASKSSASSASIIPSTYFVPNFFPKTSSRIFAESCDEKLHSRSLSLTFLRTGGDYNILRMTWQMSDQVDGWSDISAGIWIQWNGMVDRNGEMDWNGGMEWTGMAEWNGLEWQSEMDWNGGLEWNLVMCNISIILIIMIYNFISQYQLKNWYRSIVICDCVAISSQKWCSRLYIITLLAEKSTC